MDTDLIIDFASSLALLALLSWGYGILRRRLGGAVVAPIVLGGLFGLVAFLQMHAPIEPVEGVIIDLRVVPVALAGAFLGVRGLLPCLMVAITARYDIGGVGMVAGITAIVLAGCAGLIWNKKAAHMSSRGVKPLLGLALCVTVSLASGVLLPAPWRGWFFAEAAPALALGYMLAVPAIGALLERERIMLMVEERMRAAARATPDTGLYTLRDFARRIAEISATGAGAPVAAVMVLDLRPGMLLSSHWGEAVMGHILTGLRGRVAGLARHGDMLAKLNDRSIALGLTGDEIAKAADLATQIRRIMADRAMALPDGDAVPVRVDARVVPLTAPENRAATMAALSNGGRRVIRSRRFWPRKPATRPAPRTFGHHALFDKADRMLADREAALIWRML